MVFGNLLASFAIVFFCVASAFSTSTYHGNLINNLQRFKELLDDAQKIPGAFEVLANQSSEGCIVDVHDEDKEDIQKLLQCGNSSFTSVIVNEIQADTTAGVKSLWLCSVISMKFVYLSWVADSSPETKEKTKETKRLLFHRFKEAMMWALKARALVDLSKTCMLKDNLLNMPSISVLPSLVPNNCHFSAISRFVNHSSSQLQSFFERNVSQ